ncbi:MAG: nitrous oxide reductase family maturation protein NosD [Candidatus Heimdallarchaeota archaeon]
MGLTPNPALAISESASHSPDGNGLTTVATDTAILIDGNEQLAAIATSGDGTQDHPYLIANYTIIPDGHGVSIRHTTRYFILRNVTVHGTGPGSGSSEKYGFYFWNITSSIIENNTASGFNLGFYLNASRNNTLTGNTASTNINGFYLYSSGHNTLTGNTASTNSENGIWLEYSSNNTLTGNTVSTNSENGISLWFASDFNTLTSNTVSHNSQNGIWLMLSSHNSLISNTASNNSNGFNLAFASRYNTLIGNTATTNSENGLRLSSSGNNTLAGNSVSNNHRGFYLEESLNILLCLNSIRQNAVQATSDSANNIWHNGTHGNYWSDYTGTDNNNDSIGDTPYAIAGGGHNEDPYPLMVDPGPMVLTVPQSGLGSSSETTTGSPASPGWTHLVLVAALVLVGVAALALLGATALTLRSRIRRARKKD